MKNNIIRSTSLFLLLATLAVITALAAPRENVRAQDSADAAATDTWNSLGYGLARMSSGFNYAEINAIAVMGTDVYVGGFFTERCGNAACTSGNQPANYIAKWNGSSWSSVGNGFDDIVRALVVKDNTLYAAGEFSQICGNATCSSGNTPAHGIAQWNGSSWSAVGNGLYGDVYALAFNGSDLYAGGNIFQICGNLDCDSGNTDVNYLVKWNGSTWSQVGFGFNDNVNALAVYGTDLYAGGAFEVACGNAACNSNNLRVNQVAKWNGSGWSALGNGLDYDVNALAFIGNDLYAGGAFLYACATPGCVGGTTMTSLAKWNGAWSPLNFGVYPEVYALAVSGTDLYIGGHFDRVCGNEACTDGNTPMNGITKWNSITNSFSGFGNGLGEYDEVFAVAIANENMYAGGSFEFICGDPSCTADNTPVNRIARYGAPTSCTTKPPKPKLKAPANNGTVTATKPTLKWKVTNCAETYNVVIKDAVTGKKVEKKTGLTALTFKMTKTLTKGKSYKWFVQAVNGVGKAKSETRTFTVK